MSQCRAPLDARQPRPVNILRMAFQLDISVARSVARLQLPRRGPPRSGGASGGLSPQGLREGGHRSQGWPRRAEPGLAPRASGRKERLGASARRRVGALAPRRLTRTLCPAAPVPAPGPALHCNVWI